MKQLVKVLAACSGAVACASVARSPAVADGAPPLAATRSNPNASDEEPIAKEQTSSAVEPIANEVPPSAVGPIANEPDLNGDAALSAQASALRGAGGCARSRFFDVYAREGAVKSATEDMLVLDLPVDLHGEDCIAPDCYGHRMTLKLELRRSGARCEIVSARASGVPFDDCTAPADQVPLPSWTNEFIHDGSPDLADDRLERIELRDAKRREALLLLPQGYFFYVNVGRSARLLPQLAPEDATGCCYGYTSAAALRWPFGPQE